MEARKRGVHGAGDRQVREASWDRQRRSATWLHVSNDAEVERHQRCGSDIHLASVVGSVLSEYRQLLRVDGLKAECT